MRREYECRFLTTFPRPSDSCQWVRGPEAGRVKGRPKADRERLPASLFKLLRRERSSRP